MSNAPTERFLVSVEDFGAYVGIGRSLAWELVRSGQIASVKISSRRLVPRDEIERFVERLRTEQAANADDA